LSRSIEEGSTLTAALIPWTTTGIFYAAPLDLAVLDYAPSASLNWLNPLIGIAFAWLGWGLLTQNQK
jgi:NhaC family Na+:H+ antiporter